MNRSNFLCSAKTCFANFIKKQHLEKILFENFHGEEFFGFFVKRFVELAKIMDDLCFLPCRFLTKRTYVNPKKQTTFNAYRKKIHAIANKCVFDWHFEYGRSEPKEFKMLKPQKRVLFEEGHIKRKLSQNEKNANELPNFILHSECNFKRWKKE